MDWKYVLSLELADPGCEFTPLHDFRQRLLAHAAGQRLLESLPGRLQTTWLDQGSGHATHRFHACPGGVLTLYRLGCVLEAMRYALDQLSDVVPAWVHQQVPPEWSTRCGLRSGQARLPKGASKREALACQVGADGYQLSEWVSRPESPPGVCGLPALEALRRI